MILGKLLNLAISQDDEHLSTTWEIATDFGFKNIVVRSEDDTTNKTSIVFKDIIPVDGRPYYGRARIRTKKEGWSVWHNLDITISEKLDSIDNINTLPSVIGIPRIITKSDNVKCDVNNHPVVKFTIELDGYATINNTKHISTSWYVETLEGNVIWKSVNNTINKQSILVEDILLDYNKPYKIRACFHSETKDVSDLSTLTICTHKEELVALRTFLSNHLVDSTNLDIANDITLDIPFIFIGNNQQQTNTVLYFNIIEFSDIGNKVIFSQEVTSLNKQINIPGNTFKYNKNYMLEYRVDNTTPWEVLLVTYWR